MRRKQDKEPAKMPVKVVSQPTPNPNAMKFNLDRPVTAGSSASFSTGQDASSNPLAAAILAIPKVQAVFLLNSFVSVTREPDGDWDQVAPAVQQAIEAHFA
jgi:NFU1 iron-sulfur cluster scaffold homolog, mitochondrial